MREIISKQLWLGNALDVRDLPRIHDTGIRAIVDLALDEPVPRLTRDLIYFRVPIVDGAGNSRDVLTTAIEATASLIRRPIPTLVACSAGLSRSPSIVAAAIALVRKQLPDETLLELVASHPSDVSPSFWSDVKEALRSLTP